MLEAAGFKVDGRRQHRRAAQRPGRPIDARHAARRRDEQLPARADRDVPSVDRGDAEFFAGSSRSASDRRGYAAAKARIFENQAAGDWAVINADDPSVLELARSGRARRRACSRAARARSRHDGRRGRLDRRPRRGTHASAWCRSTRSICSVRISSTTSWRRRRSARSPALRPAAMTAAVEAFTGLEHAMELVAEVGGVRFVNDSKATNVESALRSIESFDAVSCRSSADASRAATAPAAAPLAARAQGGRRDRRSAAAGARGARRRGRRCTRPRRSRRPCDGVRAGQPAAWCCSRRRARASTCFATTPSADGGSRRKWRGLRAKRRDVGGRGPARTPRAVSGEQSSVGLAVKDWLLGTQAAPACEAGAFIPRPTDDC